MATMSKNLSAFLTAAVIIGLVGFVYWPVHTADFVWDDQICLYTGAALRHGDSWRHFLSADFCDWKNYFRPLIVAMFATELSIFDVAPGPMHLVSLGFHLLNTLLVGLLARTLFPKPGASFFAALAMLLYGLHPALIEPVVWISCRADLVLTFFTLLGLLANTSFRRTWIRALAVAGCFFLAACAKESAVTFPLLLVLFDWIQLDPLVGERDFAQQVQALWRRQWPVYVAVFGAGLGYLALRSIALGYLLDSSPTVDLLAQMQVVAYTFLTYWRILFWPMIGLAPTHIIDATRFEAFSATNIGVDFAAIAIVLAGIFGTLRRKPLCYAILVITIALLPVLHVVPVQFDPSLYHERYVMLGLALALALLPRIGSAIALPPAKLRRAMAGAVVIGVFWLGAAVLNIRVTVPLWSNHTRLWQWELLRDPTSQAAKINLLGLYIDHHDSVHAREIADQLFADETPCALCMINVAFQALTDGDLARAKKALERAQNTLPPGGNPRNWQSFILATGRLHELEGNAVEAEDDYRNAIAIDPLDPLAHMTYALFLARQGKAVEARATMDETLPLWPPDEREGKRREFERTLAKSAVSVAPSPVQRP